VDDIPFHAAEYPNQDIKKMYSDVGRDASGLILVTLPGVFVPSAPTGNVG
jgi:hypothetical protein